MKTRNTRKNISDQKNTVRTAEDIGKGKKHNISTLWIMAIIDRIIRITHYNQIKIIT